ncbi:MAG: CDP-glycerol glycerophosphotransferase family protein [Candidatus Krumholzibacteriota bacterium]|nr:CDP-glycerol glycerophosphotransferase family protein [Candidatus Krumholzibacteriota bacterium]
MSDLKKGYGQIMILSYYLLQYPFTFVWQVIRFFRQKDRIAFYCDNIIDYEIFRNIDIGEATFIARDRKVAAQLAREGIRARVWPSFPDAVIMARHALHRFPCKKMVRIGLRHGPYHFKKMIDSSRYDAFDLFLMTSDHEVEKARECGITKAANGGFPKLDSLIDLSSRDSLGSIRKKLSIDPRKKTVLFSATWNGSGMSAIDLWYDRLDELAGEFNILATVHPFTGRKIIEKIRDTKGVRLIGSGSLYPCMLASDILVSDTSSIIAEYCLLDRPIISFSRPVRERTDPEVTDMINRISEQVDDFDQLAGELESVFVREDQRKEARRRAVSIFFGNDTGKHGKKATGLIRNLLKDRGIRA